MNIMQNAVKHIFYKVIKDQNHNILVLNVSFSLV